jgi:hypothetical protein
VRRDRFPLLGAAGFRVVFAYAEGTRPRAVGIASDPPVGAGGADLLLWADTAPPVVDVRCPASLGAVDVYNAYIAPGIPAGLASGVMAVSEAPGGRIYRCYTGDPSGGRGDLVFRIERYAG